MTASASGRDQARGHAAVVRAIVEQRFGDAADGVAWLLADDPRDARAHMLAGRLAAAQRDHAQEHRMMARAAELDPGNGEYHALLARCWARAQQVDQALASVDRALACDTLPDLALDALAATLAQFGRHRQAADLLQRAVAEGSRNAAIHFNLGNNLKFVGDFAGARTAYERAIEIAPGFHKVHAALASLGGATQDRNNLARLEEVIAATPDPRAAIHLRHAAAKECEALGRYDDAWAHLAAGKAVLVNAIGADPRVALPALDRLADVVAARPVPPPTGDPRRPIFIVGMPRSGTTVLDRIVSNHDAVASIGESLYFAQLLKIASGSNSPDMLDDAMLGALSGGVDLDDIGTRYMDRAQSGLAPGIRPMDKLHLNFILSEHLMQALPGARILCVVRGPLDTIVSNYRQLFEFESHLYRYSLDIAAAAEFYVRFRRLAEHWARAAPERFRIVRYEDMVRDPEGEAAGIFAFCGLEWQAGCSAIESNTTSTATASAVQVRRPIHRTSVGQWRRYEAHLGAAIAILSAAGLDPD